MKAFSGLDLRSRWARIGGAAAVTTALAGIWIAKSLDPRPVATSQAWPSIAQTTEPVQKAEVPRTDTAASLLGTASSISPQTLALVLVSTVPGRTSREGTASLGTDPRNPQTYAAGATLANGAVIREVFKDHVVLELDGKTSTLTIGGKTLGGGDALTVGGARRVSQPLDDVPSSREDLSELIRPEPVFEGDRFVGLKILPGRNSGKLAALGLASGDIVRSINGKPLKTPDESWQMLDDALSTGTSIVVSVERDGTLTSMYLDGAKLADEAAPTPPVPGS